MNTQASIPQIRGEKRPQPAARNSAIAAFVLTLATLLSAVNIVAMMYVARAVNDIRTIEARLETLGDFDRRIRDRLSTMDNGLQLRLEEQSAEMENQLKAIGAEIEASRAAIKQISIVPRASDGASETAEQFFPPLPKDDVTGAVVPPTAATPGKAKGTLSYQRVESADGKVLYRRLDSE